MNKAIIVKYLSPTNTKGARLKAQLSTHRSSYSVTIPYPHELSTEGGCRKAAEELARKLEWVVVAMHGARFGDSQMVFVLTDVGSAS